MKRLLILTLGLLLTASVGFSAVELDSDDNGGVDIDKGGTNATTASAARTALGLAIDSDVESHAATVSSGEITAGSETTERRYSPANIVAIIDAHAPGGAGSVNTIGTPVDNDVAVFTDSNSIEGMNEAEFKAHINAEAGTDVQAYDADLDTYSTITPSSDAQALLISTDANSFTDADESKLDAIEAAADVTDSTNVNSAGATMNSDTDVSAHSYVLDEDTLTSDSATKLATQQSIKAYVDANVVSGAVGISGTPVDNDVAVFTDGNTVEGLDESQFKSLLNMEAGTDFESATSNDFDPDRLAGDTVDDNLVDQAIVAGLAASAAPKLTLDDSDGADGFIAVNAADADDAVMTIGVDDSGGDDQPYIELDGVTEQIEFKQNAVFEGTVTINDVSDTEIDYLNGVSSGIQGQLDAKSPIADPTFTGEIGIGAVNVSETELGALEGLTSTTTELNHSDGVTSAIQTQLDAKESATSNDIDPDRLAGDTVDDNLIDQAAVAGLTASTTPKLTLDDSDGADGFIAVNAADTNDAVQTFGVDDSNGDDQVYIENDGVNERVEIKKELIAEAKSQIKQVSTQLLNTAETLDTNDYGTSIRDNDDAADNVYTLPSVGAAEDGVRFTLVKLGSNDPKFIASDSDTIGDGSSTSAEIQTYGGTLTVEYCHEDTIWLIIAAFGTIALT